MPDNKQMTGKADRLKVDPKDPAEIEYLHSKFPHLFHREIVDAIKKAGPYRKDILGYLRKNYG